MNSSEAARSPPGAQATAAPGWLSPGPDGITVADLVARGRYPHQRLLREWSREDERVVGEAVAVTGITDPARAYVDDCPAASGSGCGSRWRMPAPAPAPPGGLLGRADRAVVGGHAP